MTCLAPIISTHPAPQLLLHTTMMRFPPSRRYVRLLVLFVGMLRVATSFLIRGHVSSTAPFVPIVSRPMTIASSNSVTGIVYEGQGGGGDPVVTLFTKEGCTLCDKVKDVLVTISEEYPHTLQQKDITDDNDLYERYKYDIPVLHVNGKYWAKHRLTVGDARTAITQAREGTFESPPGEPNAGKLERKRQ